MKSKPYLKASGAFAFLFILLLAGKTLAQNVTPSDGRVKEIRHLDLTYSLPEFQTREDWLRRAGELRKQILVSAGLLPMPARPPIKPVIFDKLDRGDYTLEKVYFESYPGFYVTGNLYRPKNVTGKVPAVLCPHGHWSYGRLENTPLNSGPARAISFARQGYVAFSYDMVGYNDSSRITHKYADHNTTGVEALWGVNLLGLQLWNSIRSIDFLLTLPEVDSERIACTGESGGGTQTFLLMAVDERVKVAAPVNMVSFLMQGGSLCENAPNLRIDTNNVELASLMAPRPMIMVSATGDWTKNTMTSEYPAVRNIYRLLGAEDKLAAVQMNAPHNYNQESREAVYGWFAHWLLNRPETTPIKERSAGIPAVPELMVFYARTRPENELDEAGLSRSLIEQRKKQLEEARLLNTSDLQKFKDQFGDAFRFSLMAEYPRPEVIQSAVLEKRTAETDVAISRQGKGDRVVITIRPGPKPDADKVVLVLSGTDAASSVQAGEAGRRKNEIVVSLLQKGFTVATLSSFPKVQNSDQAKKYRFFTTYNRTDAANQIQDILTAVSYLRNMNGRENGIRLSLVALDNSGPLVLLARGLAPKIDRMVVDAAQFDSANDTDFLKHLPIPGIRRAGDFTTSVSLAPLTPLFVYNTGDKFRTEKMSEIYRRFGRAGDVKTIPTMVKNNDLLDWLSSN